MKANLFDCNIQILTDKFWQQFTQQIIMRLSKGNGKIAKGDMVSVIDVDRTLE